MKPRRMSNWRSGSRLGLRCIQPAAAHKTKGNIIGSPFTFGPQATPLMLCTKMLLTILPFDEVAARSQ